MPGVSRLGQIVAHLILHWHHARMDAPDSAHNPVKSERKSLKSQPPPKKRGSTGEANELPRPFGRLTLLRHVARGGMGEIYLATTGGIEGAERPCVVKIIRREHADDKSFLARFFDEARIQAQLHHPGVVQVHEADTGPDGKPFVVLEYVEGRNLSEVRHRATQLKVRVDWTEAVAFGVLLAEGLAHVHERTDAQGRPLEIVHRDLSPQNVMLGYGGDVKMIDFGTARGENRRCRTVAGIVFAKPGYVAPEVANETPGGIPADIYAFGIMVWELVAGRRFLSGEASEHMAAVGSGHRNPTPLAQLVGAPKDLDRIIARATAPRVEDRYPSAREAMADLVRVLSEAPSLADGERGVRARIRHLMGRLYPAEPARSRSEFCRLVAAARKAKPKDEIVLVKSPTPAPTTEKENELLPGTRYKLLGEIGRGAMGVVHEAFHVDLGRSVAVKILAKDRAASEKFVARFRTEARAISKIHHENIVQMHDFGMTTGGQPYYAMELLEGETLERYIDREKGMDWREAVRLCMDACRALSAAHAAGVVHRDIKPANLFMTSNGTLKLLDFGVAKALTEPSSRDDSGASGALSIVGTPEYLAPEQASSKPVDERTDLYSLGAVLYELATGRLPHVASTTVRLLDAKVRTDPEPARQRAPQRGIPPMLDDTIQRALDRDPNQRFQSAEEMREALEGALREPVRRRARRRAVAYAVLGVVALGLGVAGYAGSKNPAVRSKAVAFAKASMDKVRNVRSSDSEPAAMAVAAADSAQDDDSLPEAVLEEAPAEAAPEQEAAAGDSATEETEEAPQEVAGEDTAEGEPEDSEPAKSESEKGEFFAAEPTGDEGGDDVQGKLAEADELMEQGATIKAFNLYRKIGRNHRKDARALKAWTHAAAKMKGWGEALRVARQWAELTPTPEARIHLARMQRVVGKTPDAVKTLSALLEEHPRSEEARSLLQLYAGPRVALNR